MTILQRLERLEQQIHTEPEIDPDAPILKLTELLRNGEDWPELPAEPLTAFDYALTRRGAPPSSGQSQAERLATLLGITSRELADWLTQ